MNIISKYLANLGGTFGALPKKVLNLLKEEHKKGRHEVVDWVEGHLNPQFWSKDTNEPYYTIKKSEWQSQLKEWAMKKYCYPIHPKMWDSFLEVGYTEKQLTDWGFIKSTYIEVESDIEL